MDYLKDQNHANNWYGRAESAQMFLGQKDILVSLEEEE